ncbi:sulfotransferase family protein [Glycomyces xiaoerkulensis]|uniref:sulfotransferase family protein n=1 Tax=Glycomyces xiaoerkulensis TaxID=2038139 RepID=UPI000C258B41|nr:sulfotransferase [Glycomyces xiaoerkulensis]
MRRKSATTTVLNALLKPASAGRRHPDRAFDGIVERAERRTGGDAAAVPEFVEDFRFLVRSFVDGTGLSPMGWQSVVSDIGSRLENRLRVHRLIAEHPEIADEPIERPVFIVGLPRTATTLAHNIIAQSDGHRGPKLWEWFFTDIDRGEDVERGHIKDTRRMVGTFMRLAPAFKVIHPLDAEKPDECNYLLPHGSTHLARVLMPEYFEWTKERDWLPDYEYLRQALQVLQYGRERKRWILKSPLHLEHLPELLKVFPGATIVWTHRDPVTVLGSLCSMVETTQLLHVRKPDLHGIGRMWLDIQSAAIERARAARVAGPREAFVDVPYTWLAAEPHEKVPKLYEMLGARWTDKDAGNLDNVLARPGIGRQHEYELARYGLTPTDVEEAFGDYAGMVQAMRFN